MKRWISKIYFEDSSLKTFPFPAFVFLKKKNKVKLKKQNTKSTVKNKTTTININLSLYYLYRFVSNGKFGNSYEFKKQKKCSSITV